MVKAVIVIIIKGCRVIIMSLMAGGGDKEDLKASGMASGHIVRYLRSSIHDADRALIANPV